MMLLFSNKKISGVLAYDYREYIEFHGVCVCAVLGHTITMFKHIY